jgi:hypothetical protein
MGLKLRLRHSLDMFFTEMFRISMPKFSETFRRSTAELTVFLKGSENDSVILLHILKKQVRISFAHLVPLNCAKALRDNR